MRYIIKSLQAELVDSVNEFEERLHNDVCDDCQWEGDGCVTDGDYSTDHCPCWGRHDDLCRMGDFLRLYARMV